MDKKSLADLAEARNGLPGGFVGGRQMPLV